MNAHSSAEPPKGLRLYRTLFLSSLQLSAFTFGGGYVIVPLWNSCTGLTRRKCWT